MTNEQTDDGRQQERNQNRFLPEHNSEQTKRNKRTANNAKNYSKMQMKMVLTKLQQQLQ